MSTEALEWKLYISGNYRVYACTYLNVGKTHFIFALYQLYQTHLHFT
jgi:hypothetical protein